MTVTFMEREASGHFGGGVAEWLNALVLKTSKVLKPSGVRIPHPPPASINSFNSSQALCEVMLSIFESEEII